MQRLARFAEPLITKSLLLIQLLERLGDLDAASLKRVASVLEQAWVGKKTERYGGGIASLF